MFCRYKAVESYSWSLHKAEHWWGLLTCADKQRWCHQVLQEIRVWNHRHYPQLLHKHHAARLLCRHKVHHWPPVGEMTHLEESFLNTQCCSQVNKWNILNQFWDLESVEFNHSLFVGKTTKVSRDLFFWNVSRSIISLYKKKKWVLDLDVLCQFCLKFLHFGKWIDSWLLLLFIISRQLNFILHLFI